MEPAEAVLKFLRSVGPRSEAEFYLQLFRNGPRHGFATIAVDGTTLSESADAVAMDLRFLSHLELFPVVVMGLLGSQPSMDHGRELLTRLQAMGVRAAGPFAPADGASIKRTADAGQIALVQAASATFEQRVEQLGDLLASLASRKLIFLRQRGGLRSQGQRISLVNLSTDVSALAQDPNLSSDDRALLSASHELAVERGDGRLVVAMTSPLNLLHELFTVRGAGTLLRRGATVTRHTGLDGVDRRALIDALASSFGRTVSEDVVARAYRHCYVADDYRGVALLAGCPYGGYLDKFAVTAVARGEGLGRDLWAALSKDYPALLWRARPDNPIASWYEQQCEARWRRGEWTIFMRGIGPDQAAGAIEFAEGRERDL